MFRQALATDFWIHLAALLAVAIGCAAWAATGLNRDPSAVELTFIIGGLAGLGLRLVNTAAQVIATNADQPLPPTPPRP